MRILIMLCGYVHIIYNIIHIIYWSDLCNILHTYTCNVLSNVIERSKENIVSCTHKHSSKQDISVYTQFGGGQPG